MLGIVNYSDSDTDSSDQSPFEENEKNNEQLSKRKNADSDSDGDQVPSKSQKLPLPQLFGAIKPMKEKRKKHQNRKRTFEHFEGNWATYIYIPVLNSPSFKAVYDRIVECLSKQYSSSINVFPIDSCHISISRTVPIRHYWITPIFDKLKQLIAGRKKFYYSFGSVQVYANDEKTRTFIGLDVTTGYNMFKSFVEKTDQVFNEFNLEKYYESPSFHASIAWCLGDRKEEIEKHFIEIGVYVMAGFSVGIPHQLVEKICMKTGNKCYQIALE